MEQAQPFERALRAGARLLRELEKELLDVVGDRCWCRVQRRRDRLDGLAFRNHAEQPLLDVVQTTRVAHGSRERIDDAWVEHRTSGAHLTHRPSQLVALSDAILEQVRVAGRPFAEQGDRVFGLVVLGEDHDPGARMLFADDPRGADSLVREIGWHPDIGDHDLGHVLGRAGEELVVVTCHADDVDVSGDGEQGAHSLPDYQVVVRQHDANRLL